VRCVFRVQIGDEGTKAIIEMLSYNNTLNLLGIQDNLLKPETKEALTEAARKRGNLTLLL
jgi:hypothetical protein